MTAIRRIFIANRGEIAVRIINACHQLNIETVLGVSDADRSTLAADVADKVMCIGPAKSTHSYLNQTAILHAALSSGCDALHPGYGFLSENSDFARQVDEHGLIFIGPTAESIAKMGDKVQARQIAKDAGVPIVPGSAKVVDTQHLATLIQEINLPILLKARAGGGGRGMRVVDDQNELISEFNSATAEAKEAFGDGSLYAERYVRNAKHIEVQIIGDGEGNAIHLFERDCSVQRRHQKVIEESPSPSLTTTLREAMTTTAVQLAQRLNYLGVGTVEFVLDGDTGEFYFLEMNTRIQVEHPVTEMITGVDLVKQQIKIAAGARDLPEQREIESQGHAIECRINAEDPFNNFIPQPGRIENWSWSSDPDVRIDTHCYAGYMVPPHYDSLLAKVIVHGPDRSSVASKMCEVLDGADVSGIKTIIPFHKEVVASQAFAEASINTTWVERTYFAARGGLA